MVSASTTTHRGIGPLAGQAFVGEHECVVDSQTLGDVTGDRVPMDERRIAACGPVVEEVRVEANDPAPDRDGDLVGSHSDDTSTIAVVDAQPKVVELHD